MRPKGLHKGIIEASRRHPLLSNGYDFKVKYCISFVVTWGLRVYIPEL
jgi:hypothetical protein